MEATSSLKCTENIEDIEVQIIADDISKEIEEILTTLSVDYNDPELEGIGEEFCDWLEKAAGAKTAWQQVSIFPANGQFTEQEKLNILSALSASQTHLVAYHDSWNPHFHWLHPCRSIGRGHSCDCGARQRLRPFGGTIRLNWYKHPGTYEALRKTVFYLQMDERRILSARYDGKTGLLFARQSGNQINWGDNDQWRKEDQDLEQYNDDGGQEGLPYCQDMSYAVFGKRANSGDDGAAPKRRTKLQETTIRVKELIRQRRPLSVNHLQDLLEFNDIVEIYIGNVAKIKDIIGCAWDAVTRENKNTSFRDLIINLEKSGLKNCRYLDLKQSYIVMCHLLNQQCADPLEFLKQCISILDKTQSKVNTLAIIGPAGCGKTYFVETLAELSWTCGRPASTFNKHSAFPFDDCLNKRMLLFNELSIAESHIDMLKSVFEGSLTTINCKYEKRAILQRTPCFITTNNNFILDLPHVHQSAYNQRIIKHNWHPQPWLKDVHFYPHPLVWKQLYNHVVTETPLATFNSNPEFKCTNELETEYIL